MTSFSTSTDTMRGTSSKVLANAESVQADLRSLLARLQALDGQWVGDGRLAFQAAEQRYQSANAALHRALAGIGELISRNEARYSVDDAQARTTISASSAHFDAPGF